MLRKVLFIALIISLAFGSLYAQTENDVIFGVYENGTKEITGKQVKTYRKLFGMRMTQIDRFVELLKPGATYRDAFRKMVVERTIGEKMREELSMEEKLSQGGYTNKLKAFFTDEELRDDLVEEAMDVSEEQMKEYYENNQDFFRDPDMMKCSMIFKEFGLDASKKEKGEALAKIKDIRERALEAPENFHELAKKRSDSQTAQRGGRLGWLRRDNNALNPEFFDEIFPLKEGSVSEPVELPTGYAAIYIEEKKKARVQPFKIIKERVKNQLMKERFEKLQSSLTKVSAEERRKVIRQEKEYKEKWEMLQNAFWTEYYLNRLLDESGYGDKELAEYLAVNRARYDLPQKWELRGLAIIYDEEQKNRIKKFYAKKDAREKAEKILEKIGNGADFEKLIAERSDDEKSREKKGYLGWISRLNNSVFAHNLAGAGASEFVGPVHYKGAWWILKVLRVKEAKKVSVAEVREDLDRYYRHERMKELRERVYEESYEKAGAKVLIEDTKDERKEREEEL